MTNFYDLIDTVEKIDVHHTLTYHFYKNGTWRSSSTFTPKGARYCIIVQNCDLSNVYKSLCFISYGEKPAAYSMYRVYNNGRREVQWLYPKRPIHSAFYRALMHYLYPKCRVQVYTDSDSNIHLLANPARFIIPPFKSIFLDTID